MARALAEENPGEVEKESHLEFSQNVADRPGTTAELYEGRELPGVLARLMADRPWCAEAQGYVPVDDPARVHFTPKAGN